MANIEQILSQVDQLKKDKLEENGFTNFVGNVYNKVANGQSFADSNAARAQKALDKQQNQDAAVIKQYDMLIKAAPYIEKIAQACSQDPKTPNGIVNTLDNIAANKVQGTPDVVKMAKNVKAMFNNTTNGKNSLSQILKNLVSANNGKDIDLSQGLAKGIEKVKAAQAGAQPAESNTQNGQAQPNTQTQQSNVLTQKDIAFIQKKENQAAIINALTSVTGKAGATRIINTLLSGK